MCRYVKAFNLKLFLFTEISFVDRILFLKDEKRFPILILLVGSESGKRHGMFSIPYPKLQLLFEDFNTFGGV
jgi:hypothetical protein